MEYQAIEIDQLYDIFLVVFLTCHLHSTRSRNCGKSIVAPVAKNILPKELSGLSGHYLVHRGVDNAITTLLNYLYKHLEGTKPMQGFNV